ncbi:MAG: phosphatidate cytidylyltransferase [Myxococcales bacterium]|nr:phosphatidate cytidylyltransferase [Myxococcales bacterium]
MARRHRRVLRSGRFLGKHKLGKRRCRRRRRGEGAFGGIAGSLLAAIVMKLTRFHDVTLRGSDLVLIAVPGAMLGQMGDLIESLFSGRPGSRTRARSCPGHGGILDRIDAVLFFAPYVYVYMQVREFVAAL